MNPAPAPGGRVAPGRRRASLTRCPGVPPPGFTMRVLGWGLLDGRAAREPGRALMPTRRILEVALIGAVLIHPIMGLARLWAAKTLLVTQAGSVSHGAAEIVAVVA